MALLEEQEKKAAVPCPVVTLEDEDSGGAWGEVEEASAGEVSDTFYTSTSSDLEQDIKANTPTQDSSFRGLVEKMAGVLALELSCALQADQSRFMQLLQGPSPRFRTQVPLHDIVPTTLKGIFRTTSSVLPTNRQVDWRYLVPEGEGTPLASHPSVKSMVALAANDQAHEDRIRLVNGTHPCEGRVEVFHSGVWGTVCGDSWDMNDASVVCKQMGCGVALQYKKHAYFGYGTGPVLLDNVECFGNESSIFTCSNPGWGNHDCGHHEDVGVICADSIYLQSGEHSCEGRVEVFHNRNWGTVCNNDWDMNKTSVICRQLGCGAALEYTKDAYFGAGTAPIEWSDVSCSGNELYLSNCSSKGRVSYTCKSYETVGVTCQAEGDIRLVNETDACQGRLEIFHNGSWGTVCGDGWDMSETSVVCQQLGCGKALGYKHNASYEQGTGAILMDAVNCNGSEPRLAECSSYGWGIHNCDHSKDIGVICAGVDRIRLVNGTHPCEGRVEILYNGVWGTVCDDSWDMNDANVVCEQLDCRHAVQHKGSAYFGYGTGPILLDEVNLAFVFRVESIYVKEE
nr:PREDICTED: deleted in malignant brain tumors 1 protein-like [Latimeria chalumnae]|eukprot:XP_005988777.2 PREDICTED: deleted in malignant brain tumors 1 protein-like [Latimeria chalumnae]